MSDLPTSLRGWLTQLAQQFAAAELSYGHGTDNPWDEAVALTLGALGWADNADLLDQALSREQIERLESLAARRIAERLPVPLLLGRCQFAGMEFLVEPDVMIPRSPIAELIRTSFAPWLLGEPARALDVCCGGGCIGLAMADQFPAAQVTLLDIADAAVALCARNIDHHQLGSRVRVMHGDLYAPVAGERFDLIVSNPPYVPTPESNRRPDEFLHEPDLAYDGGISGMDLVGRLLAGAGDLLSDSGLLVIEVGQWRDRVEATWPSVPFIWPELHNGGEGILVLEGRTAAEHTAAFQHSSSQSPAGF